jgi:hypothetical protein
MSWAWEQEIIDTLLRSPNQNGSVTSPAGII